MLKIINNLSPFFEDCYRWISVREYGRLVKVSPPTASKLLKEFKKAGYLQEKKERKHHFFLLNNEDPEVIDLSRMYWKERLNCLLKSVRERYVDYCAVLFGSLAKGEATPSSDVDIALFSPKKNEINIEQYTKTLKREISIHWFESISDVKNKSLLNNILNGYILSGRLRWL